MTEKTTKEGTVSTDSAVAPLPKSWSQTLKGKFWGKITLLQQKKKNLGNCVLTGHLKNILFLESNFIKYDNQILI